MLHLSSVFHQLKRINWYFSSFLFTLSCELLSFLIIFIHPELWIAVISHHFSSPWAVNCCHFSSFLFTLSCELLSFLIIFIHPELSCELLSFLIIFIHPELWIAVISHHFYSPWAVNCCHFSSFLFTLSCELLSFLIIFIHPELWIAVAISTSGWIKMTRFHRIHKCNIYNGSWGRPFKKNTFFIIFLNWAILAEFTCGLWHNYSPIRNCNKNIVLHDAPPFLSFPPIETN